MNLEEAKANIGKEVIFIGERVSGHTKLLGNNIVIDSADDHHAIIMSGNGHKSFINLREIKLKEQAMQNYKIKVTPETSAEVQELFFNLGGGWSRGGKEIKKVESEYFYLNDNIILIGSADDADEDDIEITLPQLRDLVVLKRNDVGDSTHVGRSGSQYYHGCKDYLFDGVRWMEVKLDDISNLTPTKKESEMTWEDALRAVADGKEVEVKNISWFNINDLKLGQIKKGKAFRIKPQTIPIIGGNYTKEELLKIAGEME